jgi:hypothetical protein
MNLRTRQGLVGQGVDTSALSALDRHAFRLTPHVKLRRLTWGGVACPVKRMVSTSGSKIYLLRCPRSSHAARQT